MPKLDLWSISKRPTDGYQAPELWKSVLQGIVSGHPRHPIVMDGEPVSTSTVISINVEEKWAETSSGTIYELGDINPEWVKWFTAEGYKLTDFLAAINERTVQLANQGVKH